MFIDKEGTRGKKEEEQGSRALKKRRRQNSLPSMLIEVSSERSPSAEQPNPSPAKVTTEGFNHAQASHLDVAELLGVNIDPKNVSYSSKTFVDFIEVVTTKLDLSKV